MTREKPDSPSTSKDYLYIGSVNEGEVTISWADEFYGPQMKWYDGTEWVLIDPDLPQDEIMYDDEGMKKIRTLKPDYIKSRYPTKSKRRRTREQGLRDDKAKLSSQVATLEAELAALRLDEDVGNRLPNPNSRKMRF